LYAFDRNYVMNLNKWANRGIQTASRKASLGIVLMLVCVGIAWSQTDLDQNYVPNSGDKIYIHMFDEQDLTMQAAVDSDGNINPSFLGSLKVNGRSTEQIEQTGTELLKDGYQVTLQ